ALGQARRPRPRHRGPLTPVGQAFQPDAQGRPSVWKAGLTPALPVTLTAPPASLDRGGRFSAPPEGRGLLRPQTNALLSKELRSASRQRGRGGMRFAIRGMNTFRVFS